jgi:maltose/moltooligosaccharide transporter
MPTRFKSICIIHSVSWAGIFIFWLYFTTALAQNFYGLPLHNSVNMNSKHSALFQSATLDSSFYFSIYQYVSIVYSGVLYFFSKNHTRNIYIHAISLCIGSIAILLFPFEKTVFTLECAMVAYGIMWGSIMVLPYAIAIRYIPRRNLGIYLGIFNICITAPQIVCGLLLSLIYYYLLRENASYLLSFGGFMLMISSGLWIKFIRSQPEKEYGNKLLALESANA